MKDLSEVLGIKNFDELVSSTLQTIVDGNAGITNISVGSVTRTLTEAILNNVDESNYYINYVYNAMGLDTATGEDLDRLIDIFNITRRSAVRPRAVVRFYTGDSPATYTVNIPQGYKVGTKPSSDGTVYTFSVIEHCVIQTGEKYVDVNMVCDSAGYLYLPSNSLVVMTESLSGVQSVSNVVEISSGEDAETDDELRGRAREYMKSYTKCTNMAIKTAVEDIDGVVSCDMVDLHDGPGTSAALVVTEIIPIDSETKKLVEDAIRETKASGVCVSIIYPSIKYIDIVVTITNMGNVEDVKRAMLEYCNSLSNGQTFVIKQMERKVLNVLDTNSVNNDDIDITTTLPTTNIDCDEEQVIRLNSMTINGVKYNAK